ncbi:helix-turn-helix transcriptional regulator [Alteromonas sp. NFXS44]|uniref:helix-turn-helix domain-containing protein n=1 Tax=unclassified Alteromonas TaxID=2614992 RepID=UPI0032DF894A
MQKSNLFLHSIGKLVQSKRSASMDQQELAVRCGVGRNTISNIENGRNVSVSSLLMVLEQLELIDDFQVVIDEKLNENNADLVRKSRKYTELDNDF